LTGVFSLRFMPSLSLVGLLQTEIKCVRFQVLTASSMKFGVFWDIAPCSLVGVDRCFRGVLPPSSERWMMAVRTSAISLYFNETARRYIPEDFKLDEIKYVDRSSHTKFN
jgi:hypothetical protein